MDSLLSTLSHLSQENGRLAAAHQHLLEEFQSLKLQLYNSLKTLELIVAHLSEGLLFVTLEGRVSLYNPAAEKLLQLPQSQVQGNLFWDSFADDFLGFSLKASLQSNSPHHSIFLTMENFEEEKPKTQVKEIELSTSFVPEQGLLILLRDRSEIEHLERTLHQSTRLKELGEMAATLAHEIRNPLGGIEGFASLLKRDLKEPKLQEMTEKIIDGSKMLNKLVTQVLDYARPLSLHFSPCDFVALIKETLFLVATYPDASSCLFESAHETFVLSIDRDRIQLVLFNLLKNAFEASTKKTPIHLYLNEKGILSIQDQGEGIAPSHLRKLFTPFFTTKAKGTGLGLAEAYKVVQAHGGSLTVESIPGKTTFILNLREHAH